MAVTVSTIRPVAHLPLILGKPCHGLVSLLGPRFKG
jgi:hypothetical protein